MDAANYIESMKSSNKEPDPQQIKDFYNSGGTTVYKMLFGDEKEYETGGRAGLS
ncbi:hypothetical protein Mapa_016067 [Marchantia paleacea]|nr:hypothetical protein Mapa_016067 [Marchantia paleacea]